MTFFKDKSLLITRPLQDSVEFSKEIKLLNNSLNIVIAPLFEIKLLKFQVSLLNAQAIITTSLNAVRSLEKSKIKFLGPMFCVGSRTAELATQVGFFSINANGNSSDLKKLIRDKTTNCSGKLVYFRGEEISVDLAQYLRRFDYKIEQIICYKKKKTSFPVEIVKKIHSEEIGAAVFFSKKTVSLFFDQVLSVPDNFVAFCISDEVSSAFKSYVANPMTKTRISKLPNSKEMCKMIATSPEFLD